MCKAIQDWLTDEREAGKIEGAISICRSMSLSDEIIIQKLRETFSLSESEAAEYL